MEQQKIALQRLGFGQNAASRRRFQELGYEKYVLEQLNPTSQDEAADKAIANFQLEIQYNHKGNKVKENRPLSLLKKSLPELWQIRSDNKAHAEKIRPAQEVAVATILRAQHSRWQLREVVVDFWHNHFNVNALGDDRIAVLFPHYDREVIRKHAFGNFRQLLEAVAKSPCMLFYLDNAQSKASPANENYARELLELHTLGGIHYLNNLYDQWREVPKDQNGEAKGYIDEDVYEAARAFTGWTVADGSHDNKGGNLPNTGEFHYCEHWHDQYQKRVLGTEIPHHQSPLADGLRVLDLLAYHPATARYICKKLCLFLLGDEAPESLLKSASELFLKQKTQPNQLKDVISHVLLHPDYLKFAKPKAKTPLQLLASLARATDTDLQPNQHFYYMLQAMGHQLFGWPTPDGHPLRSDYWLNTNFLLSRWNATSTLLLEDWHKTFPFDIAQWLGKDKKTCLQLAQNWYEAAIGNPPNEKIAAAIASYIAMGGSTDDLPYFENERQARWQLGNALAFIAQLPDFQMC